MASGYTITGRGDLDDIFKARTGTARANTGYAVWNGTVYKDIADRYEPRGSTTKVTDTVFRTGNVDLAELFMDKSVIANTITITDLTASATDRTAPSGTATAQYSLTNLGDIVATGGTNTTSDVGDWLTPKTNIGSFSVYATVVSGAVSSGTTGAWLNLATTRTWTVSRTAAGGTTTTVLDISIRSDSDGVTRATARITLSAIRAGLQMVAGYLATNYNTGYSNGNFGSLVPNVIGGKTVGWMYDYQTVAPTATYFAVALDSSTALTKGFFNSVKINGTTYSTAAASFDASNAPYYIWTWIGRAGLVNGGSYEAVVT